MQLEMRRLPFDLFCFSKRNEGLGKNTNKGLKAATGHYILHLQDDWSCKGPPDFLQAGIEALEQFPDVGMVRYRPPPFDLPGEARLTRSGNRVIVYQNRPYERSHTMADHPYTDNPHIKRREFHELIGYYKEKVPMTVMELEFSRRVAGQENLRVALLEGYNVFSHTGEAHSFNPCNQRERLKQRLLANPVTRGPMLAYLWIKRKAKHA
jgi:hypothetical protein